MINSVEKQYDRFGFCSYKLIFTDGRIYSVPLNTANSDYQAIQEWIAAGNSVIDPNAE